MPIYGTEYSSIKLTFMKNIHNYELVGPGEILN